jgi:small subunit ribosomal protein S5
LKKQGIRQKKEELFEEKLIRINRVSKTVKGGRRISFSVLAAVGDKKGQVGIGLGKANGVPEAIKKAVAGAKKNLIKVALINDTIPHDYIGKFGATRVLMKPAAPGTGVISGSATRDILELAGVHNVVTKIIGSKNKANVARATLEGLKSLRTAEEIANLRGKSVEEILG